MSDILSPRDAIRAAVDQVRGVPALLGMRPHTVTVRVRQWSGERPGEGNVTQTDTQLLVAQGQANPKVRNVSQKDAIASGGLYTEQDLVVDEITPPYPGSTPDNSDIIFFDPPVGSPPTEVFFRVTGPGYPADGAWFKKIGQRTDRPFRYTLWLRATAVSFA